MTDFKKVADPKTAPILAALNTEELVTAVAATAPLIDNAKDAELYLSLIAAQTYKLGTPATERAILYTHVSDLAADETLCDLACNEAELIQTVILGSDEDDRYSEDAMDMLAYPRLDTGPGYIN